MALNQSKSLSTADNSSLSNDKTGFQLLPGLQNLGNTCFANSVMQCLVHNSYIQKFCSKGRHCGQNSGHDDGDNSAVSNCAGCRSKIRETQEFKDAWRGCNLQTSDHGVLKRSQVWQIVRDSQLIQTAFLKENFCSFCIMEYHIKLASHLVQNHAGKFNIKYNQLGQIISPGQMLPLSVIIFIKRLSEEFQIGRQADAQEFLLFLLENLIQSSFGYQMNVSYRSQWESFVPMVFQGMLEQQIICCSCKDIKSIPEPFLNLSLVSLSINTISLSCFLPVEFHKRLLLEVER